MKLGNFRVFPFCFKFSMLLYFPFTCFSIFCALISNYLFHLFLFLQLYFPQLYFPFLYFQFPSLSFFISYSSIFYCSIYHFVCLYFLFICYIFLYFSIFRSLLLNLSVSVFLLSSNSCLFILPGEYIQLGLDRLKRYSDCRMQTYEKSSISSQ